MKKIQIFAIAILAMALFSSCDKEDQGCGLIEHTYKAVGSDCWLTDRGYDLNCDGKLQASERINSFPVSSCEDPKTR